ncbi:MAG: GspE/PulE family protein [Candidatus Omnitrophota bacterium]|nr:GspE/PulE family protein [Candidatus Omnitrophota bacterium]
MNKPPQQTIALSENNKVQEELGKGSGLSIVILVDLLIEQAHHMRASDIHIVPLDGGTRVRLRIDGVLQDQHTFPEDLHSEIITRIKILSGLRTDEHQTAQDGRFRTFIGVGTSMPIDVRVSITPTYYGENAVLRLLSDKAEDYTLETLGFSPENQKKIMQAIRRPYGMILATGPTGSGKTTSLYTLLKTLNTPQVAIITIEDPIEYAISGIEQIQVNSRTGLTFANGLRSILRQDPNIIMVGEIRDRETAGIAVNTALTGHLLLSTLHTNDAATTLPRLLDMGIEPYLIASTVNVAMGQRLVRKICEHCRVKKNLTAAETASLKDVLPKKARKPLVFFEGTGCTNCNKTGYRGRVGIQEVMLIDAPIREAILRKATAGELKKIAAGKQGMTSMLEDGFDKAMAGITTIEEILRMLHE